jgi:hypothetical protein
MGLYDLEGTRGLAPLSILGQAPREVHGEKRIYVRNLCVPGTLSLKKLEDPAFSSNFSHQKLDDPPFSRNFHTKNRTIQLSQGMFHTENRSIHPSTFLTFYPSSFPTYSPMAND